MNGSKSSAARALAAVLVLAACTAEGSKPVATAPPPEPVQEAAVAAPEPVIPEAEVAPEVEFAPLQDAATETAVAALEMPEPEPDIDDDPGQVMDLEDAALEALLGEPGFRRAELNAQVWQYLGESCVLDVYLYSDGAAAPYRVTYFEVRADGAGAGDDQGRRCFRGLLLARADG